MAIDPLVKTGPQAVFGGVRRERQRRRGDGEIQGNSILEQGFGVLKRILD